MYTTYSLHNRYLTPAAGFFLSQNHAAQTPVGWLAEPQAEQKSGVESMSKQRKFSTEMIFQSTWGESLLDGFFNHYMLGFAKSSLFSKLFSYFGKQPTYVIFLRCSFKGFPNTSAKKTTVDKLNFATRH